MIDIAVEAAKKAGELAYRYFKTQPKVTYKPDNTPVTRADLEVERFIRKIISKKFPDHGIIGEELGSVNPQAKFQWVIDPVDGTRDFARSIPFWSTLLAVLENSKPLIGIAFFPVTDEFFIAQKGKGTFLNNKKVKVSKVADLKFSYLLHGSIDRFEKLGKLKNLVKLGEATKGGRRSFGSYNFNLLLKGNVDVYLEPGGGIYDFAAPAILVTEAGGKFTDFEGKFSLTSGTALFSNGLLHSQVLKLLNY